MQQRVSLITLGTSDLPAARAFYEALGWRTAAVPQDDVVFFQAPGLTLGLSSRAPRDGGGITLAYSVGSPAEVDATIGEAQAAGARIPRAGGATPDGGYAGMFLDPDGHAWEVAHDPHWSPFVGVDHVQVAGPPGCEDDARRFYGELLGLRELSKPAELAKRGGVWFEHLHVGVEDPFAPARKAHPALRTVALGALADRLTQAGHEVTWDDAIPGVRRFYVADPFGNRVEITQ